MAYPGLILAYAALEEGVECHIFFTFWGFEMINKETMNDLKFSAVGNPATHMPTWLSGLPGMQGMATKMMKKQIDAIEIPEVPEMIDMVAGHGRPPVGLPDVRRHAASHRGRSLRRRRGHHLGRRVHRPLRGRPDHLHLI